MNGQWSGPFSPVPTFWKILAQAGTVLRGEAVVTRTKDRAADIGQAQDFLNHIDGRHETVDSEPGLYRHTEIAGDGFRAFELTSLLPKTGFDLHVAKMAE